MYHARLFSTKSSRGFEVVYNLCGPVIIWLIKKLKITETSISGKIITILEKPIKGWLFDCQMCGNCVLSSTGMTCPMNCPKNIRNGPCGGVRIDGNCEVKPEMPCVWVQAWSGAKKMKNGNTIQTVQFAVNQQFKGTSSWLKLAETNNTTQDNH